MKSKLLTALVVSSALATPAVALAQDTGVSQAEDAQSERRGGVGEIIVTAQKKSETAQRTPAAVLAVGGDDLTASGITDIRAAQALVPGARFQKQGVSTQVFIRGIGANLDLANIEPSVAFNVNGMFLPRESTVAPLFDLERIEVLPGPQGTLYGRAAIGGTINAYFNRPTFDLETSGTLEAGNYSKIHATLVQNVPLSDTVAIRLAADYENRDGYQTSGADSADDIAARAGLLYEKEGFTGYIWGYYFSKGGVPANLVLKGLDPVTGEFREDAYINPEYPWDDTLPDFLAFAGQPQAEKEEYKNFALGGQFDFEIGSITLSYIPTYHYLDNSHTYWLGQFPANLSPKYKQHSHELKLAGDSDAFEWLIGAYGYEVRNSGTFDIFPGIQIRVSNIDRNYLGGVALFGQGTYSLTDVLRVTAGARLSYNKRKGEGLSALGDPFDYSESWTHLDYKVGLEYDIGLSSMAYATVQTAFQPGTYNEVPFSAAFDNRVKPAKLTAFSAGIKNRFLDDDLQLNLEAYFYDYSDLFLQSYDALANFNPIFNAEKVEIYGFQIDAVATPTANDRISLSVAYTHGENKDFITPDGRDFSGFGLPFTPDWTVTGSYHHDFTMRSGHVRAQVEGDFQSGWFGNFTQVAGTFQEAVLRSNASLTYYDDNDWSIGAYIKNITDEAVVTAIGPAFPGLAYTFLAPPRTYGVRFRFRF